MDTPAEDIRISHRAMAGKNLDDLYLIPSCLADRTEFPLTPTSKFVRCRGVGGMPPVYTFIEGLWERRDGELCEEEPGMIYVMGHVAQVLAPIAPIVVEA